MPGVSVQIHPSRPFADGICYDDCDGMDDASRNHLASIAAIYLTEFKDSGRTYGGCIVARSIEQAEQIAFGRGLGEEVIGLLVETGSL